MLLLAAASFLLIASDVGAGRVISRWEGWVGGIFAMEDAFSLGNFIGVIGGIKSAIEDGGHNASFATSVLCALVRSLWVRFSSGCTAIGGRCVGSLRRSIVCCDGFGRRGWGYGVHIVKFL